MSSHTESLSGGLFTSLDPALLQPGQLSDIRNAYYRRGSQALQRAKGRTVFATATGAAVPVLGLRDLQFDNGDHFLVGLVSAQAYRRMQIPTSVTASAAVGSITDSTMTAIAGKSLEAVHYRNRYFLLNGASAIDGTPSTNRVIYLVNSASATGSANLPASRAHGLLPVDTKPVITTAAGVFSAAITGWYEYWTTEVIKLTADGAEEIIESGFRGDPTSVYVDSANKTPIIQKPPKENQFVGQWRVYRSPMKATEAERKFPTGSQISSDLSNGTLTFTDTETVAGSSFFLPTISNAATTLFSLVNGDWTNPDNVFSDNAAVASATVPSGGIKQSHGFYAFKAAGVPIAISGPVRGIEVVVEGYVSQGLAPVPIKVTIGPNRLANGDFAIPENRKGWLAKAFLVGAASRTGNITSTNSASPTTLTLGGPNDRWYSGTGPGISAQQFDANFMMVVTHSQAGAVGTPNVLALDYVQVKVYTGGASDSTLLFPTVVYDFSGDTSQESRNGLPPSSSCGDVFEDSLVLNDVGHPSFVRWSFPGNPDAFPSTYFIDFETRDNDIVNLIKVVNSRLVVGLEGSVYRVNYLPSERDASFDRGKAIEPISRSYGCVNPMCAALFSMGGSEELLAIVSKQGIFSTNGFGFEWLTDMLDWRKIISTSTTSFPIALINDPENHDLVLYYRNDDDRTRTYLALHLSYAPEHVTNGKLKVSGPVVMRNYDGTNYAAPNSAVAVPREDGTTSIMLGYGPSPEAPQYGRPAADLQAGAWKGFKTVGGTPDVDQGTTDMYQWVDETGSAIDNTDYISALDTGSSSRYHVTLSSVTAPGVTTGHILRFRGLKTAAITTDYFDVYLYASFGGATIMNRQPAITSTGYSLFELPLTPAEAAIITSYSTIVFTIDFATSTSAGANRFKVSWVELEVPGVGSVTPGAGQIFIEQGTSIPADDPAMSYTTRRMYLAGVGQEWRMTEINGYMSTQCGTPTLAYTARTCRTGLPGEVSVESPEVTLQGEFLHQVPCNVAGDGIRISMDVLADHNDMGAEFLVIEAQGLGKSE